DRDGEGVAQAGLERRDAARLAPHAVGDRAREAEGARAEVAHVDGVAVAGDGRIAAAEIAPQHPGVAQALGAVACARCPGALLRLPARWHRFPSQHHRALFPYELAAGAHERQDLEALTAAVRLGLAG